MMRLIAIMAAGAAITISACEKKEPAPAKTGSGTAPTIPSADATRKSIDDAAKSAGAALAEGRDRAVAAGEASLAEIEKQLATLRQKASSAAADARPAMEQAVKDLDTQLTNAKTELQALRASGADAWQKASADFQAGLTKLDQALKGAMEKYGK